MAKVKDPVCGMMVDTMRPADRATYGGEVVYFCSTACRKKYDAARAS